MTQLPEQPPPRLAVSSTGRLTATRQLSILRILRDHKWTTRYRLCKLLHVRRLEVVYRAVSTLEALGLVTATTVSGSAYQQYQLTEAGKAEVSYWEGTA